MNAEIISIGTELLLGEITDTNATHIARQLRDIGINLYYITAVGDNLQRITDAIKQGLQRSDVIITTGGLGPTVDDVTRQSVAAATGRELVFHQHLLDQIAERFRKFNVTMTDNNRQQAYVPNGAIIVENPVGTAPSFIVESDHGTVISLPGVPREMKYLLEHNILPYLRTKMGLPAIIKAKVLHTAGIGESLLDDAIGDLMTHANPTVGLAAHSGQTDIRITARAETLDQADAMIAEMEAKVRERVGRHIFGADDENLEEAIARFLLAGGVQMVVLEAGTGGVLTEKLNKLPGAAQTIKAVRDYPDIAALRADLNIAAGEFKDLAAQSLDALCGQHGVQVGLAVLYREGIAALAVRTPHKSHSRELNLGSGAEVAQWASNWGLGYIWRYLRNQGE